MRRRVALIGLGLHAQYHHYDVLERLAADGRAVVPLLVDVESNRDRVESFLQGRVLQPENKIFIPPEVRKGRQLWWHVEQELDELLSTGNLDGVLIATDPTAHFAYLEWAVRHGVAAFTDKPVTAPADGASFDDVGRRLLADFDALEAIRRRSGSQVMVATPRRAHQGYQDLFAQMTGIVNETGIAMNAIRVAHRGGRWNMPDEYRRRPNHSFDDHHGEGLQSGYHHADLLAGLVQINSRVRDKWWDWMEVQTQHVLPSDHMTQVGAEDYARLFADPSVSHRFANAVANPDGLGELDVRVSVTLRSQGKVLTLAELSLSPSSVSFRRDTRLPLDTYKGMGQFRQDEMLCGVPGLADVTVTDSRPPPGTPPTPLNNTFLTRSICSPLLPNLPRYDERVLDQRSAIEIGTTVYEGELTGVGFARLLVDFMEGRTASGDRSAYALSELSTHAPTVALIGAMYRSIHKHLSNPETGSSVFVHRSELARPSAGLHRTDVPGSDLTDRPGLVLPN